MITFLVDHDDKHGHRHELTEDHGEQERINFGWSLQHIHQLKLRTLLCTAANVTEHPYARPNTETRGDEVRK